VIKLRIISICTEADYTLMRLQSLIDNRDAQKLQEVHILVTKNSLCRRPCKVMLGRLGKSYFFLAALSLGMTTTKKVARTWPGKYYEHTQISASHQTSTS
jgi:hypothetical protein